VNHITPNNRSGPFAQADYQNNSAAQCCKIVDAAHKNVYVMVLCLEKHTARGFLFSHTKHASFVLSESEQTLQHERGKSIAI
jgi:hypothetical protein